MNLMKNLSRKHLRAKEKEMMMIKITNQIIKEFD